MKGQREVTEIFSILGLIVVLIALIPVIIPTIQEAIKLFTVDSPEVVSKDLASLISASVSAPHDILIKYNTPSDSSYNVSIDNRLITVSRELTSGKQESSSPIPIDAKTSFSDVKDFIIQKKVQDNVERYFINDELVFSSDIAHTPPSSPTQTTTTTLTQPHPSSGYCVHTDYSKTAELVVADAESIGAGWIKQIFEWRFIQPNELHTPDKWDWSGFDVWFDETRAKGINIIPRLQVAPDWAKTEGINSGWGQRPDLDKFDDYAVFVAEFVKRYNLQYVEVWNEPNFKDDWTDKGPNPEEFVLLMKTVDDKLREYGIRNNVKVILGGLGPTNTPPMYMNEFEFLKKCYEADSDFGKYYDILGHHPYGFDKEANYRCSDGSNENCWAFDRVRLLKEYLWNNLGDKKPLMFTEFGWRSDHGVSEDFQAENLQKSYNRIKNEWPWVEKACWWILSTDPQWDQKGNMFNQDGTKRKTYYCYQHTTGVACNLDYKSICEC